MPLRGSILQVGTCQILNLAENPRWSRVWQNEIEYENGKNQDYLVKLFDMVEKFTNRIIQLENRINE